MVGIADSGRDESLPYSRSLGRADKTSLSTAARNCLQGTNCMAWKVGIRSGIKGQGKGVCFPEYEMMCSNLVRRKLEDED